MKIAADANVLLSAVLGGRASLVLNHPDVDEIVTSEMVFAEVQEYAVVLGRKKGLASETLMLAVAALPVSIVAPEIYQNSLRQARKRLAQRDPDDVELLALALHFEIPIWSNDNDFEECGVEWFTTAELLRKLGITEGKR